MKMFKRIFATLVVVVITICALLGASYLMGSFYISVHDMKENATASITEVRTVVGFVSISAIYTAFRVMDFFEFIFKLTGDKNG